jgi:hypothetical protein
VTESEPATTVSIASGPLVGPILRRVVGMLAARADLPLDRLDDAVLVADLIAARAPAHSVDDKINVALDPGERSLLLRVGPLRPGGGQALIVDAAVPSSSPTSFPSPPRGRLSSCTSGSPTPTGDDSDRPRPGMR